MPVGQGFDKVDRTCLDSRIRAQDYRCLPQSGSAQEAFNPDGVLKLEGHKNTVESQPLQPVPKFSEDLEQFSIIRVNDTARTGTHGSIEIELNA